MDKAMEAAAKAMDAAQDSFFETVGFETTPPSEFKRRAVENDLIALGLVRRTWADREECTLTRMGRKVAALLKVGV